MGKSKSRKMASGASKEHRRKLREQLDIFVAKYISVFGLTGEAIVAEIRYWHQSASNPYRTNASKADKTKSFNHYKGKCQTCGKLVNRDDAVFHHHKRGIVGQHKPDNLVPYHNACHDKHHHKNLKASMIKGSKRK